MNLDLRTVKVGLTKRCFRRLTGAGGYEKRVQSPVQSDIGEAANCISVHRSVLEHVAAVWLLVDLR